MPVIYPGQKANNESILTLVKTGGSIRHKKAYQNIYQGEGSWTDIGKTNISLGGKISFNASFKKEEKEKEETENAISNIVKNVKRTKGDILGSGFKDM